MLLAIRTQLLVSKMIPGLGSHDPTFSIKKKIFKLQFKEVSQRHNSLHYKNLSIQFILKFYKKYNLKNFWSQSGDHIEVKVALKGKN